MNYLLGGPSFRPHPHRLSSAWKPTIEAPKPCTTKDFAVAILDAIGVPSKSKMTEGQLFATVKAQLRERGILYLHVDEAQHLQRHSSAQAILDVQDRLKSLMQIEDWPLHTIYSGTPQLADLLTGDQQLANRAMVMRFGEATFHYFLQDGILHQVETRGGGERAYARIRVEDMDDLILRISNRTTLVADDEGMMSHGEAARAMHREYRNLVAMILSGNLEAFMVPGEEPVFRRLRLKTGGFGDRRRSDGRWR